LLAATASGALTDGARKDRHVVMISLDGFGAYNLGDPRVALPNIRALAARGARADAMTVSTPSVTWPNHTTLVTGVPPSKHGVLANGRLEPATATPMTINGRYSKTELCRAVTVYDVAHKAGLKTAEVNWPVTRDAATLDFRFPDHPDAIRYSTPSLVKDLVGLGLLATPDDAGFRARGVVGRDEVWAQAAVHLLKTQKPNLLLLHLLNTDGQQHAHGPLTTEAFTALALADRYVGDVVKAIADAGLTKRATVIVTSDHGFVQVTKLIRSNARLRTNGLIRTGAGGKLEYDAQSISEGGIALVYVPGSRTNPALLERVRQSMVGLEGVERVVTQDQYGTYGLPLPGQDPQAPHLVLAAKDGYAFSNETTGEDIEALPRPIGAHGYLQTNPKLDGAFIIAGAGVRSGTRVPRVVNLDVAPSIARLLGLRMENVDGHVLTELLTEK